MQKILARAGIASRRTAEQLISEGRVTIDGQVVTAMGVKVDPGRQRVECDGKPLLPGGEEKIYVLLNKPRGYVTTMDDPQGRPIVSSLLKGIRARVFPVGRLDIDTEGALLLTNDGELAQKIQHPSYEVNKTYEAIVDGCPDKEKLLQLSGGIMLEGRKTWPARIKILSKNSKNTKILITIHEGRKRQVRKMFEAVGHRVLELKRVAYGKLKLGDLPRGKYRLLRANEMDKIFDSKKSSLQ